MASNTFLPLLVRRLCRSQSSQAAVHNAHLLQQQQQVSAAAAAAVLRRSFADSWRAQPPVVVASCSSGSSKGGRGSSSRAFASTTYERRAGGGYAAVDGDGDDEEGGEDQQQKDRKFIDRRRLVITAGNGGSGAVSFMKDGGPKMRRGADGGNGGDGASVWIKALRHVKGLGDLPFRVAAENGGKGAKQGTQGKRGKEVELGVPVGTVVWREIVEEEDEEDDRMKGERIDDGGIDFTNWGTPNPVSNDDDDNDDDDAAAADADAEAEKTRREPNLGTRPRGIYKGNWEILCDLEEHGSRVRLAKGGRGGKGNKFKPTGKLAGTRDLGTDGEKLTVMLELKSVADIGLVGFPNAGKSTLLRAISGARPNVADYAFTTMQPQLGAVKTDGGLSSIVVADIPGLIEGAHKNRGLGHNFLRHVERCSAFLFVVDLSSGMGGKPGVKPWDALDILRDELERYLPGLSDRPALVVGTKTDIENTEEVAEKLRKVTKLPVVLVSANEAKGIETLLSATEVLLKC